MATLYRRGKIWWARAQRQNREYRISLKTRNRRVAQSRLGEWLGELEAIAWGDKPKRAFKDAAKRFITEHLTAIKPGAAKRYGVSLKHWVAFFGPKTLDQITKGDFPDFETKRRNEGASSGTIRRDFACLSSLFTSCEDWEWVDDGYNRVPSYMRRRAKRGLREAPGRTRYLTEAEEAALLDHATSTVRSAIVLAIDTGLRREELFGLKWSQVDLARGLIDTGTRTKSGRARPVPIPERSRTILGTLPRHLECPYVLVNPETENRYVQMNKGFKAAARRAKITDIRWHDLRRTAGCRWLQRDRKSKDEVSDLLGHSSVLVTEKSYAFLDAEAVAASLASLTKTGTGTGDSNKVHQKKQRTKKAA